jgi:beta-glucanase (GH16 family)
VTRFHNTGLMPYDCGRALNATSNHYTKRCPFSGAMIHSKTWPGIQNNGPSKPPAERYSGRQVGYGRIEIRAKIAHVGHGAWPALWLFSDQILNPHPPGTYPSSREGGGELDLLEYLAFDQNDTTQIVRQTATFGNAVQTGHNWGIKAPLIANGGGYPHTSEAVGIPISLGEFHTDRVDYEPTEIRFYIDNCLRNRITEGQLVKFKENGKEVSRPFVIPQQQLYNIIISSPASSAHWLPNWYKATTDATGRFLNGGSNFRPTELHVDYVRYYTSTEISKPATAIDPAR